MTPTDPRGGSGPPPHTTRRTARAAIPPRRPGNTGRPRRPRSGAGHPNVSPGASSQAPRAGGDPHVPPGHHTRTRGAGRDATDTGPGDAAHRRQRPPSRPSLARRRQSRTIRPPRRADAETDHPRRQAHRARHDPQATTRRRRVTLDQLRVALRRTLRDYGINDAEFLDELVSIADHHAAEEAAAAVTEKEMA